MTETCPGCSLPVEPGELRYTGRAPEETWHAHCWSAQRPPHTNLSDLRAQMATAIGNVETAFDRLRSELEKKRQ